MNPLEIFQKEAPEVAKAFNGLVEALKSTIFAIFELGTAFNLL